MKADGFVRPNERPSNVAALDETFKKTPESKRKASEEQALPGM